MANFAAASSTLQLHLLCAAFLLAVLVCALGLLVSCLSSLDAATPGLQV
jgi:hypothetical protein